MRFEDIHLVFGGKLSLWKFHFKKKRFPEKIKYFYSLYKEYKFLKANCIGQDEEGCDIFDGTYSVSLNYKRYKIYLRKKRFEHLPNWLAILISLVSLAADIVIVLWQLGLILQ